MSRTENIKRNLIFNTIRYATHLFLQFVLRTVLIYVMGEQYLGLNGLFSNIFAFLNLAELGIGSAIVFSMYKPIAEHDVEKVKALQNLYKKFYLIISGVVLVIGLAITPFLRFLIKEELTISINEYILYLMYLLNTLVGYFSAHKRSLLFACQRNDLENKIKTFCLIMMTIVQIILLLGTKNYYVYYSITIVFTIIESIIIHKTVNKYFAEFNGKGKALELQDKKEIGKNVAALSMHKVGSVIVNSTDNLLISIFFGITLVGAYSNYYLIITSLMSIFAIANNSILGSMGDLAVSRDVDYVYDRYKKLECIFSFFSSFTTVCLIVLFQPFMNFWTGGGVYLLDFSTVVLLCVIYYLGRRLTAISILKEATGIFTQDRWRPICEAIINLVTSIVFALWLGINGIFIGTIVSSIFSLLIGPTMVYKHYFKKSSKSYFIQYFIDFCKTALIGFICLIICHFIPDGGVVWLIVKFATCVSVSVVLLFLIMLINKDFRLIVKSGINWIKKIFKHKTNS